MIDTIDARTSADQILVLERRALDRWGRGDPDGFLELYAVDITYFDPSTATPINGHQAMVDYYRPWVGKIRIARYEMLNPRVVVDGTLGVVIYNLVNYVRDAQGVESVGSRWNSTTVYQHRENSWRSIHSHWSFTRHPALQNMTPEASERLEA
jgi:ketosteroid isomerase-like protein